jgi:hypothetical protein
MNFDKGMKKVPGSGRKKGTPHKKSLLVREILENHGINLVEQILVRLPQLDKNDQVKALTQLLPYVYPKLVSAEISTPEGFKIIMADYTSPVLPQKEKIT